ncbi:unnamed protein product [Clonostachys solani]|uniref:SEC7 domain-containing protein n=1 Tax=Clonostachys solani TaxID=160281 RepID=A0A9N9VX50_9HYPO|nr:unnamed protein product [Clonostachys solani]
MADHHSSHVPRPHPHRDSHDLSLSTRDVTRDSLVTNMLVSLDKLSFLHNDTPRFGDQDDEDDTPRFFDIPRYRLDNPEPPVAFHNHTRSLSYSSDIDTSSRLSSQYSRDRRSNSNATIQDVPRRASLVRETMRRSQSDTPKESPQQGSHRHKSGSVGSGSIDGLQSQSNGYTGGRWGRSHRRSASIDQGSHPSDLSQVDSMTRSLKADRVTSFNSDDMNAAPNPTVPGGPRKPPSTAPKPSEPAQSSSAHRNRSSSRSVKSSSARNKTVAREPAPPLPTSDSAPAPAVGYGKPKEQAAQPASNHSTPQPKEKQGFFKRVFGGSSRHSSNPIATTPDPSQNGRRNTGDSPAPDNASTSTGSKTQGRDTASSHSNHPVLQKKTSFFRRRKKSVVDDAPPVSVAENLPPVPPLNLYANKDKPVPKAETSPVSSLRQVMNPYLRDSVTPSKPGVPAKTQALKQNQTPSNAGKMTLADLMGGEEAEGDIVEQQAYKRDFSPEYEPNPNARIRKVQSDSSQEKEKADQLATPSRSASKSKTTNSFLDLDGPGETNDVAQGKDKTAQTLFTDNSRFGKRTSSLSPALPSFTDDDPTPKAKSEPFPDPSVTPRASSMIKPPDLRIETTLESGAKIMTPLDSKQLDEPEFVLGQPTEDDRQKAQRIFDGNEDFIQRDKAASWMGEEGPVRKKTLQAYMDLYDFTNQSVVQSLRQVCSRLVFRAETQQVDRILVAFSKRWCACNPNHGFKASDIIHTICYSIMLLNTDLHMADIEQKMTRSQFVKNTMGTIIQALAEVMPDALEKRPPILSAKSPGMLDTPTTIPSATPISPTPTESERRSFRNSFRPPPRGDSDGLDVVNDCGPLVKSPHTGNIKSWEEQVEIVLKSIYNSIRDERLPLFGADPQKSLPTSPSQGLGVMNMLRRTPSVLSKAPSEGNLSMRGRNAESTRGPGSRWVSKSRSRPPGLGRNGFNSSRTSFEDNNSLWSPALSSATWSRQSLGRTQTTVSQDSFASAFPRGDYQQSIGFANALSQAIIRDEDANGYETAPSILSADITASRLLEDETLEITGPPWVKEGRVIHKHHLDGVDKKAKDRQWTEVFAVVQKGQMSLFSFNSSKSQRQKARPKAAQEAPVGGGNWQDNATNVGTFNLRQTLASALPSPGYSRTRPHVWALSLPTGAVHLFQVGTPEIIKEFVTTANYWSARLSTHPLIGGVSNMEYGWSENIVNNALVNAINDSTGPPTRRASNMSNGAITGTGRKGSISSFRSASIDQAAAAFTNASGRGGKLPGDRVNIADWTPPAQSLRPSNASETDQLATLVAYVKNIEESLQEHNQLRSPMLLAFTPRGHNAIKAMANWEKKSAYLLREIVKFRTYVDCLQQAETRKQEIYAERDLAHRAARGELMDDEMDVSDDEADTTIRP